MEIRHDLRTPITAILGYGELMAEEARDRGDTQLLEPLAHALDAMTTIASVGVDHYRIPLPVVLSDSTHGDIAEFGLREAGVDTASDETAGGESYVKLRAGWNAHIERLAPAMGYGLEEVDPAGFAAAAENAEPFRRRRPLYQ